MRHPVIEEDLRSIAGQPLPWNDFACKTVLVTGAAGFLPAYMVEVLLWLNEHHSEKERSTVYALVRNREKAERRFAAYQGRNDLRILVQDVCAPIAIAEDLDYIIHAASQASPKYYGVDPVGTLSANVLGTHQLLEHARSRGCRRLLFFSSGEVYGTVPANLIPIAEDTYGCLDPLDVRSCYAESKRMAENMVASWHHQYGVPATIVRPFHTYGPGMDLGDGRVFADFVSDIVQGRDIVMKSDGIATRAFCYLADAVAGFFTVLFHGQPGEAYNIGNDKAEISIADLADLLANLFPEKGLRVVRQEATPSRTYLKSGISRSCPDISRARELGWEPTTDITRGFQKTIRSFT